MKVRNWQEVKKNVQREDSEYEPLYIKLSNEGQMDGLDMKHGWIETLGSSGGKPEEATRMALNRRMNNAHAVECHRFI